MFKNSAMKLFSASAYVKSYAALTFEFINNV